MATAVIGTRGLGSVIVRELASGGETLRLSRAILRRHERWLHRSAGLRSSPPATATRCGAPMPSSSCCGLPC
jgi:hypothetical protein